MTKTIFTKLRLPFSVRCLSAIGAKWPISKGRGKLVSLMKRLAGTLNGYYLVALTIRGGKVEIAVPFPDDASFSIATFGEQDPHLFQLLSSLCRAGGYFVDVGANLGVYSLRMPFQADVATIAVEPQNELSELLRFNADLLGIADRIEVKNVAVGEFAGSAYLELCEFDRGRTHVGVSAAMPERDDRCVVRVQTLKEILDGIETQRVAAIKIDAEGFEPRILRGMSGLFSGYQPPIVIEINRLEHRQTADEILGLLERMGYQEFFVVDRKIYPLANGALPICNVLALSSSSAVLEWLEIDRSFVPFSSLRWPVTPLYAQLV